MWKKKSLVYKVLEICKEGHTYAFDKPWNHEGRKHILDDAHIDNCVRSFAADSAGEKMTKDHVNKIMVEKTATVTRGVSILLGKRYNPTTLNNYSAEFASRSNIISITTNSNPKVNNQWTAEHSLIGLTTLLILVALTHFYVADKEDLEWRQQLSKLSDSHKMLYTMLRLSPKVRGRLFLPV